MKDVASDDLALASDFPPASRDQWRALVDAVLKGAPFDRKLVSATYDGLRIEPLYERLRGAGAVAGRPATMPWRVMARVDHPDPAIANRLALEELEGGATGLSLVFADSVGSCGFGIDGSAAALAQLLDGVYLDAGVAIECELSSQARDAPAQIASLARERGIDPAQLDLRAGFDPLGLMARRGGGPVAWTELAPVFARMVLDLSRIGLRGPFAVADARVVHDAGGSEAQELAFALAVAVAYLRALEAGGLPLDRACASISFRLAADADQFLTMAKFRALRRLWARVQEACGLDAAPAFVSAVTAWRMMTRRDPYVNMLRTTIAAFAAGLGGADSIVVLPFTAALGLPDAWARRVARNSQLILLEESGLAKVADPAAGSGGIEDLTDKLCRASWTLFQEIEAAGGAAAALETGLIQAKTATTRAAREKAIATRRDPLTGTSEFAHLAETPVSVIEANPPSTEALARTVAFAAMPAMRLSEPFEALRDAADRLADKTGTRPKVFLANLGRPADFIARATFARNVFAAGGIEAVDSSSGAEAESETVAAAFRRSGAKLACLCSSDEVYAAHAAEAARALARAGAAHIYVAGRPDAEGLQKAGVQSFVYAGCDVLATLRAAHAMLEPT